jgi:hypothetical protein
MCFSCIIQFIFPFSWVLVTLVSRSLASHARLGGSCDPHTHFAVARRGRSRWFKSTYRLAYSARYLALVGLFYAACEIGSQYCILCFLEPLKGRSSVKL